MRVTPHMWNTDQDVEKLFAAVEDDRTLVLVRHVCEAPLGRPNSIPPGGWAEGRRVGAPLICTAPHPASPRLQGRGMEQAGVDQPRTQTPGCQTQRPPSQP